MRTRWMPFTAAATLAVAIGWWGFAPTSRQVVEDARTGTDPAMGTQPDLAPHPSETASGAAPAARSSAPLPLEGRTESSIEGTVRRDGKPTAARVELRTGRSMYELLSDNSGAGLRRAIESARGPASKVVDAGEDGRFSFQGVASGTYHIRAQAMDGEMGSAGAFIRVPGIRTVADVDLKSKGATLNGHVLHADGSPWRGDVLVLNRGEDTSVDSCGVGVVETDSEGKFSFVGIAVNEVSVMAVAPDGSHVIGHSVVLPAQDAYSIVWEDGRTAIAGRVLSAADRTPIVGAEVLGASEFGMGATDFGRTGEDGRFRVLVPTQRGAVAVRAPGFLRAKQDVTDPAHELEFVLQHTARIHGTVVRREDHGAVVGAEVTLLVTAERRTQRAGTPPLTDSEGRFAAEGLAPGEYSLYVRGGGRVSAAFLPAESAARVAANVVLKSGDDVELTLETVSAARIVGTVKDVDGAGVEGAFVAARWSATSGFTELSWEAYGSDEAATGRGGAFEFPSTVPGAEYELSAVAAGSPGSPKAVVTTVGDAPVSVDLVLPRGRWIDVTVLEAGADAPVTGATVHAATMGSSRSDADGRTDDAGRVRLGPLAPGEVLWNAEAAGFARSHTMSPMTVVEGPHGLTATIRLERAGRIAGHVLGPDGKPAAGATVTLTTPTSNSSASGTLTRSGDDGSFAFEDIGKGDHTLRATFEQKGLASDSIPAATGAVGLILRLVASSVVARVLDADGNPVPFARGHYLYMLPGGGSSLPNNDVRNGRLVIDLDDVAPTTTGTLTISEAADGNGTRLPLGQAVLEGVRPGQEVEVRLPRERTIEGRVLGSDGKGVAGVRVLAERVRDGEDGRDQIALMESPWVWDVSPFVKTDATGAFRFGQLTDGPHYVAVLPPPPYASPTTLRRDAGATSVDFKLRLATPATVVVLDSHGKPVADALVVAVRSQGQQLLVNQLFSKSPVGWSAQVKTDADGRARLEGIDSEATLLLGARGPDSENLADAITLRWSPADTTLRLVPGLSISGIARDAAGKPLREAGVDCLESNGVSRTIYTGADGTFRFTGLAKGTVSIEARFDEHYVKPERKTLRAATKVEAGSVGVELTLR